MREPISIAAEIRGEQMTGLLELFGLTLARSEGTFEQREAAALALANEVVRRWIEDELARMARSFGDEVEVDGQRYRRHSEGVGAYHTLVGRVEVSRACYRLVGVHNGPTVVPLDLRAGLREQATPALAFSVTQGFAERPLRHYEAEMVAAHRRVPSRSTLERIGKRIGAALQSVVSVVEPEVRLAEPRVSGAASISFGLDRTTVPMAEPDERPDAACRSRARVRRPPAPVTVAYRMGYVGTVSIHDVDGTVLVTKRFAATPQEGPADLVDRVGAEVLHQLARYGELPITIVQDGAPELWTLVQDMCARHSIVPTHQLIDRYHVDERLAQIAELITYTGSLAQELRGAWKQQLDRSDTAIDRICRRLYELLDYYAFGKQEGDPRPSFWDPIARIHLPAESERTVSDSLEYFRKNKRRICYATAKRQGCPIGSGPTEGACKSVVTMRFKRSGQRWFETGLSPCLSLRALHLSDRLRGCFARVQAARFASLEAA